MIPRVNPRLIVTIDRGIIPWPRDRYRRLYQWLHYDVARWLERRSR